MTSASTRAGLLVYSAAPPLPPSDLRRLLLLAALLPIGRAALLHWGGFELHFDEAQYWEWSRRLDWSYYSKGPLVAWLIAASTSVFGQGEWQVRLPGWLAFDAFVVLLFLAAREMAGSSRAGWWAVTLALATPLYFLLGGVMTTDVLLLPLWTLGLWAAYRIAEHGAARSWYALGVAVGLGALTKLSIGLLPLFAGPLLLLSPKGRETLRTPHPWLAALLALGLMTPLIVWNAGHDWVLFRHERGHVAGRSEEAGHLVELLLGQIIAVFPLLLAVPAARLLRPPPGPGQRVVWGSSVMTLGFFVAKAAVSKVQINWPAPAYVGVLLLLAARAPSLGSSGRRTLQVGVVLGALASLLAHFPGLVGLRGERDPFAETKAWRAPVAELARRAGTVDFILTTRYTLAGELAFYWPNSVPVYLTGDAGRRMNQYDLWPGVDRERGRSGLVVLTRPERPEFLDRAFSACDALAPVHARTRSGEVVRTLYAWRCADYRPIDWPRPGYH
jgi:4-amino-4-deoxy-L-arabinose transferase-like glycosyltransferase